MSAGSLVHFGPTYLFCIDAHPRTSIQRPVMTRPKESKRHPKSSPLISGIAQDLEARTTVGPASMKATYHEPGMGIGRQLVTFSMDHTAINSREKRL